MNLRRMLGLEPPERRTLWHITSKSPEELGEEGLLPHRARAVDGKVINGVWASDIMPSGHNPYIARTAAGTELPKSGPMTGGMLRLDDIVLYGGDNIEVKEGRLKLKKPNYAYCFPSDDFKVHKAYDVREYVKEGSMPLSKMGWSKIDEVTELCGNYDVFQISDVEAWKRCCDARAKGKDAFMSALRREVANGNAVCFNDEIGYKKHRLPPFDIWKSNDDEPSFER